MIPNIRTLGHIDTVIRRLPQWRGDERTQVLEACKRRLLILRRTDQIDAETFKRYNAQVLPKLAEAQIAKRERDKAQADLVAVDQMTGEHAAIYQAWYNVAVLGYGQL